MSRKNDDKNTKGEFKPPSIPYGYEDDIVSVMEHQLVKGRRIIPSDDSEDDRPDWVKDLYR